MKRALLTTLAASLALCAPALAADEPDLVPQLPAAAYPSQVAPVFVDAYEEPGKLLYRFDAILHNQGGTLDIWRDPTTGEVKQGVWNGGEPTTPPQPGTVPSGADVTAHDGGGSFAYVFESDHSHWHFFSAARYELLLPGGGSRVSDKIGFCLIDSYDIVGGTANHFPASQNWCGSGQNQPSYAVRMGLSRNTADRYRSQLNFQWVDITGLHPGSYTLRATANPNGELLESDTSNNALDQTRVIPGVEAAASRGQTQRDTPVALPLAGAVVAPEVPARKSLACQPGALSSGCYVRSSSDGPLTFALERPPANGSASLGADGGLRGTALYTPREGFTGTDSFSYRAVDARGLRSAPVEVDVAIVPRPPARARVPRLVSKAGLRRSRGAWQAVLRLSAPVRVVGLIERGGGAARRLRTRRFGAGRRLFPLGRVAGPRRLVELVVSSGRRSELVTLRLPARR